VTFRYNMKNVVFFVQIDIKDILMTTGSVENGTEAICKFPQNLSVLIQGAPGPIPEPNSHVNKRALFL
jgi:hypothetical protein